MEAAERNALQLKGELRVAGKVDSGPATKKPCHQCGRRGHGEDECHFKDFICNHCKERGHLAKVCHSRTQSSPKQAGGKGKGQSKQRAKWIKAGPNEREADAASESAVLTIIHTPSQPITVQMEMNGQSVSMELDTGASVSLMSHIT